MNSDNEKKILQIREPNSRLPSTVKATDTSQISIKRHTPVVSFSGSRKHFSLRRLIIPILSILFAFLLLSCYAEHLLSDRFSELAKTQGEKYLSETVNAAVEQMAKDGLLTYSNMVKTIRDPSGEVIYLEVDTAMLAKASAQLVRYVDDALKKQKRITLSVPLGSLGGWELFSGIGFPVRVQIFPIGTTEGKIYTVLEDCGINQTRHLIRVDLSAKLHLILPKESVEAQTSISLPLGERVLVGDVPEIYLDNIGGN
ncbi:MAG: sporulation protein YunB [Ruminococcaceae bacterium]|nr:sporulation protein YunB [Oscillospiraceae bacterium]